MTIFAGADVGGSGCRAMVCEHDTVLGRAEGLGGAVRPGRALHAASTIAATIRLALSAAGRLRADALVVGAAGAGRDPERSELESALRRERLADHVLVTTDVALALADAFGEEPGIVVNAGTGSMAIARLADGSLRRSGGYGWQMGDEGSGYAIGRAALAAVSRALDGRGPASSLVDRIQRATRLGSADELVRWAVTATPAEVAGLARTVLEAEAAGDDAAHGIADFAARELASLALSLVPAFAGREPVDVALAGSLLSADSGLRARVMARLAEESGLRIRPEAPDALRGAIRMAQLTIGR